MIRTLSLGAVGATLALMTAIPAGSSAQAAEARETISLPGVYAALPTVRTREAGPTPQPEIRNRPAQRERRCAFGIFPQGNGRCIA